MIIKHNLKESNIFVVQTSYELGYQKTVLLNEIVTKMAREIQSIRHHVQNNNNCLLVQQTRRRCQLTTLSSLSLWIERISNLVNFNFIIFY